jgi:hypothetical protein
MRLPDVLAKVTPLRPKLPRKIGAPLKAEPRSKRYMLIGTAFDYLLRFEAQRRAPHAVTERWVAEYAPNIIWRKTDKGGVGIDLLVGAAPGQWRPPEEVARQVRRILDEAKVALASYLLARPPTQSQETELAGHAIRLGKLDSVCRAHMLDPRFEDADTQDIQDLVTMLAVVPWNELLDDQLLLLNPTFRLSSNLVGGADADLISGRMLVDLKTTKRHKITAASLDQLLGYFLLARHQRRMDGTFPVIDQLALYFGRHGRLQTMDAETWTRHPQFAEVEDWFIKRAKQGMRPPLAQLPAVPIRPQAGTGPTGLAPATATHAAVRVNVTMPAAAPARVTPSVGPNELRPVSVQSSRRSSDPKAPAKSYSVGLGVGLLAMVIGALLVLGGAVALLLWL